MKNKLKERINNWLDIGANKQVLDWIKEGVKFPFIDTVENFHFDNKQFFAEEKTFIASELEKLLFHGQIEQCEKIPKGVSPINCVKKKSGKFRLITDLRYINSKCSAPKFKNEDITYVINNIEKKDYMVTADLKDGFFHVRIHESHQDYLGFSYEGVYYRWMVLPFGHCCSPFYFAKILRPIISYLRSQGLKVVVYVDDFILLAPERLIEEHKTILILTLQGLGFIINYEKSSLEPSLVKVYLGHVVDNTGDNPVIRVTKERIRKLRRLIRRTLNAGVVQARTLARIAGQCISMCKCVFPGKLLLRNIYRLLKTRSSWAEKLQLDEYSRNDLLWLLKSVEQWNGKVVKPHIIDLQLTTDASASGWGGWILNEKAQGYWEPEFQFPRVVRCVNVPARFQRQTQMQECADPFRQCYNRGYDQWHRGFSQGFRRYSAIDFQGSDTIRYSDISEIHRGTRQHNCRQIVKVEIRMATPSQFISVSRQNLGSSSGRQVRVAPISSTTSIQFIVPRSVYVRGGRTSTGLASQEQFRECPVRVVAKGHKSAENTESSGYNHRATLDSSTLVQRPNEPIYCASNRATSVKSDNSLYRKVRTSEKQEMATVCLESVWATRLRCLGWSKRAATQTIHSLADSTISTYNSYIKKYVQFCETRKVRYADNTTSAHIADFLCSISDSSDRLESSLKLCIAALNILFHNLGLQSPAQCKDIEKLVTSLVKTGTKKPMKRQGPMPIEPFMDLFMKLGENGILTLRDLRMKAITLLALCAMTRPSDLAPKGKTFNVQEQTTFAMTMRKQDVTFKEDGSMTVQFHGIKK
ncbi:uncharacterized protein LOC128548064 [Mercenaria mercenaria]|uniref:uncharacterized protein LOC128548064 n=1 Tax=Mercenaria mercenaria TaxID=6596 RepID=UPI00234F110D|nr:uncharacterized protein LOC128548064 [Mercenaria mercenaria]